MSNGCFLKKLLKEKKSKDGVVPPLKITFEAKDWRRSIPNYKLHPEIAKDYNDSGETQPWGDVKFLSDPFPKDDAAFRQAIRRHLEHEYHLRLRKQFWDIISSDSNSDVGVQEVYRQLESELEKKKADIQKSLIKRSGAIQSTIIYIDPKRSGKEQVNVAKNIYDLLSKFPEQTEEQIKAFESIKGLDGVVRVRQEKNFRQHVGSKFSGVVEKDLSEQEKAIRTLLFRREWGVVAEGEDSLSKAHILVEGVESSSLIFYQLVEEQQPTEEEVKIHSWAFGASGLAEFYLSAEQKNKKAISFLVQPNLIASKSLATSKHRLKHKMEKFLPRFFDDLKRDSRVMLTDSAEELGISKKVIQDRSQTMEWALEQTRVYFNEAIKKAGPERVLAEFEQNILYAPIEMSDQL